MGSSHDTANTQSSFDNHYGIDEQDPPRKVSLFVIVPCL